VILSIIYVPQDEKFDSSGPSISELVGNENVDKLDYMGWLIDQGADPKKVPLVVEHV
jgi:hypothetical protein